MGDEGINRKLEFDLNYDTYNVKVVEKVYQF